MTRKMAAPVPTSLPHSTVQAEWNAMMDRLKEVARVRDHSHGVDALEHGFITLARIGSDLAKAEEIVLCNLLFNPRSRIEDEETVEIVGDWLWNWRRYTPWTCTEQLAPRWTAKARPNVRMYQYQLEQNVKVEL